MDNIIIVYALLSFHLKILFIYIVRFHEFEFGNWCDIRCRFCVSTTAPKCNAFLGSMFCHWKSSMATKASIFAFYNLWIPNTFIDDSIQEILGSYNDLCRTTKTLFNCVSIDLKFVLCFFQLLYNFIMFFIYIFSLLIRSSSILICCLCIKMKHVKKPFVIYISDLL